MNKVYFESVNELVYITEGEVANSFVKNELQATKDSPYSFTITYRGEFYRSYNFAQVQQPIAPNIDDLILQLRFLFNVQENGGGGSLPNYSTTEQATGQTYLGSTVYQRTFENAITIAGANTSATLVSGMDIDFPISVVAVDRVSKKTTTLVASVVSGDLVISTIDAAGEFVGENGTYDVTVTYTKV